MNNSKVLDNIIKQGGVKHKAHKGGGKASYTVGLWCDKNGKQKHIKARALGVKDDDKVLFTIENNNIIFNILTQAQVKECDKQGIAYFTIAKDGMRGYHNYIMLDGLSQELWDKMVEINGGVKRYNINDKAHNHFIVKRLSDK